MWFAQWKADFYATFYKCFIKDARYEFIADGIGVDLVDMRDPRVCGAYEGLPDECGDVDVRFHGGDITDSWRLKKQKNSHEEE